MNHLFIDKQHFILDVKWKVTNWKKITKNLSRTKYRTKKAKNKNKTNKTTEREKKKNKSQTRSNSETQTDTQIPELFWEKTKNPEQRTEKMQNENFPSYCKNVSKCWAR